MRIPQIFKSFKEDFINLFFKLMFNAGISNLTNSCFISSALQITFNMLFISDVLLEPLDIAISLSNLFFCHEIFWDIKIWGQFRWWARLFNFTSIKFFSSFSTSLIFKKVSFYGANQFFKSYVFIYSLIDKWIKIFINLSWAI